MMHPNIPDGCTCDAESGCSNHDAPATGDCPHGNERGSCEALVSLTPTESENVGWIGLTCSGVPVQVNLSGTELRVGHLDVVDMRVL